MPVPERLVTTITKLEFIEMRDETWMREEEDSKLLAWPRICSAPVTAILQLSGTVV